MCSMTLVRAVFETCGIPPTKRSNAVGCRRRRAVRRGRPAPVAVNRSSAVVTVLEMRLFNALITRFVGGVGVVVVVVAIVNHCCCP